MQQLKKQEEELKRWLSGHTEEEEEQSSQQRTSSLSNSFYDQETPGEINESTSSTIKSRRPSNNDEMMNDESSLFMAESAEYSFSDNDKDGDDQSSDDTSLHQRRTSSADVLPSTPSSGLRQQRVINHRMSKKKQQQQQERSSFFDESNTNENDIIDERKVKRRGMKSTLAVEAVSLLGGVASEVKRRLFTFSSSSLRTGSDGGEPSSLDVENPKYSKSSSSSSSSSLLSSTSTKNNRSSSQPQPNLRARNTREVLRKIAAAILTNLDDETLQRPDTETILIIITLLKEAMFGIFLSFVAVSLVLFIDHRFLLNFNTARNFRKATFAVMNDPVTLKSFEEDAGLKFMDIDEYNNMANEIKQSQNQTKVAGDILESRHYDLVKKHGDLHQVREEATKLRKELGLDQFCDTCMWSDAQQISCSERVKTLGEKYKTPKFEAMMSAMQKESCRNFVEVPGSTEVETKKREMNKIFKEWDQEEEDEKMRKGLTTEQEIIKDWHKHSPNFCGNCPWEEGMRCDKRAAFLNERYGTPMIEAYAKVMVETENCRHSYYEKKINDLGGFCGECTWGTKKTQTCNARVEYLMYTYKNAENVAKLEAMKRPECIQDKFKLGRQGGF